MRRPLLALALVISVTALLAACSASAGPEWTYAPPAATPDVTAAPSGDASAEPSAAPSEDAGGGGTRVDISALNVAFEQTEISVPADVPFVIHFSNKDAGIPHNVEIKDQMSMSIFKGDIIDGVAETDYQVPALPIGTYPFICSVHPNMTGTLKAGG